ncbi:MAG: outer membrane beta-barrel protein [Acidobacteriota bacterium]|nr:MAG: outer membrane beta-barrel protein [Acidobacteriota bacterium]
MRKGTGSILVTMLVAGLFAVSSGYALGPVDGEVGVVWWANEQSMGLDGTSVGSDADALGGRAEVWLVDRWGVRAGLYRAENDMLGDEKTDYGSLDVMARVLSVTERNYLAVGVGWEQIEFGSGAGDETSGLRVIAEGRLGFGGIVYGYGQAAYMPSLDDFPGAKDVDGMEYDLGVSVEPAPFVSLRVGYRTTTVDFQGDGALIAGNYSVETDGFHAGVGLHF